MTNNHPGPIRVSPNGRYFIDRNGDPFFWLADTAWPLYNMYPKADAEAYLTDRASRGFNAIQAVAAWGNPVPDGPLLGTPADVNCNGDLPWDGTPDKPNDAFFQHVDHLVRFAEKLGLTMVVWPTQGVPITDTKLFNVENAYTYGLWVGKRYRDQSNIIWVTGCDREPNGSEDLYGAMAAGLREGDGGAHLISYLPCGWRSSSYYFHGEDWLDFNMIETWTEWTKIHPAIMADRMMDPAKPVVLAEPAYENGPEYPMGPMTPLLMRRQAWWTFMAGGAGFSYGQDQNWRMEPGWQAAWDTPGARQMTIFKQIATSREWWKMIPDQGLFSSGVSSDRTLNAALRAIDRSGAMLYLSEPCHVLVHTDRIVSPKVRATWIDPRNGDTKDGGVYETGNGLPGVTMPEWKTQWFSTPGYWEDAVLILDGVEE